MLRSFFIALCFALSLGFGSEAISQVQTNAYPDIDNRHREGYLYVGVGFGFPGIMSMMAGYNTSVARIQIEVNPFSYFWGNNNLFAGIKFYQGRDLIITAGPSVGLLNYDFNSNVDLELGWGLQGYIQYDWFFVNYGEYQSLASDSQRLPKVMAGFIYNIR
jgi:hypothetical protein